MAWSITGNNDGWSNAPIPGNDWAKENNPCPVGWRIPTRWELDLSRIGWLWTPRNGVNGGLFGTAPSQIFLPAAGQRNYANGLPNGASEYGVYWGDNGSELTFTGPFWGGRQGTFFSSGFASAINSRPHGNSVRCVAE
jgi:hypothetical protein